MSFSRMLSLLLTSLALALLIIFLRCDILQPVDAAVDDTPPVADAGEDQSVTGPILVQLDGSGSSDDVGISNSTWEFEQDGETVLLEGMEPTILLDHHGEYTITLTVADAGGNSDTDQVVITVITPPGEIPRLTVIGRNNWVEIDWDPPVHDGGSTVEGCIVYRGTTPDTLEPYFSDWWIRFWSWDYLAKNGITYYYAVAAINEAGMGPLTEVVNCTPMAVPDSPENLTIEVIDGAVHISWDPPPWSTGRVNVTGYQVHRGTDPDWLYDTWDVEMNTSFVDDTVEEGVTYYYVVGAMSDFGGSTVTELTNVTVGQVQEEEEDGDDEEVPRTAWIALILMAALFGIIVAVFIRGLRKTD